MELKHPIIVFPAVPTNNGGIKFLHMEEQLEISNQISSDVWKILSNCNGFNNINEITEKSKLDKKFVEGVLSDLEYLGIIADSNKQYIHFHEISSFPSPYYPNLTQHEIKELSQSKDLINKKEGETIKIENSSSDLFDILSKRRSCRNFSLESLSKNDIGNICRYAYSINEHVVPSGGGLYPIRLFVLVEKAQKDLLPGYYEYDGYNNSLIRFNSNPDIEQIKYCFSDTELPFNSSVQIVLFADFNRQSQKYGNRSYRLALLEAGHVCQNINLYCAEHNLGACELGGMLDIPISEELKITDKNTLPLIAIAVGKKAINKTKNINELAFIEDNLKVPNGPIKNIAVTNFDHGSFFGASASFGDSSYEISGATSTSSANAMFKAAVEGYERYRSTTPRVDSYGKAKNLTKPFISPNELFPLNEDQLSKVELSSFNEDLSIGWTLGKRVSDNSEVYVPSDYVFYPEKKIGNNKIYYGNSSGIAAFSNYDEAIKRGLTELIERDALMKTWYYRQSPDIISYEVLPTHIKNRIDYYKSINRDLYILLLPSSHALVIHVLIIGKSYPFISSGAAASINNDLESAATKALQEAEYSFQLESKNQDKNYILNVSDVHTPMDHAKYYQSSERLKLLSWLWEGQTTHFIPQQKNVIPNLINSLNCVIVDLSENGFPIKVVRVISPILTPISFGYNLSLFNHPSLEKSQIHPDSIIYPHYFS
jgi:thiazole/oxazole-forming peptide maturase SagD family component